MAEAGLGDERGVEREGGRDLTVQEEEAEEEEVMEEQQGEVAGPEKKASKEWEEDGGLEEAGAAEIG